MITYADSADLETKLEKAMVIYTASNLPEAALAIIRKEEAKKIADRCKADLIPKKEAIERIEAGKASLGYTTKQQEVAAFRRLVECFEFTAISLAIFKKKYDIM